MAETTTVQPLKRQREDEDQETVDAEEAKRQKPSSSSSSSCSSYDQILCLIEEEPYSDLTSLITTLQQEMSSDKQNDFVSEIVNAKEKPTLSSSSSSSSESKEEDEEGDRVKVMRHLLEASDDELGIPSNDFGGSNYEMISKDTCEEADYMNGGNLYDGFGDALWELEDEAANYYTLLQSELFM